MLLAGFAFGVVISAFETFFSPLVYWSMAAADTAVVMGYILWSFLRDRAN